MYWWLASTFNTFSPLFNRFVILKLVPRDLTHQLPVPTQVQKYLNTPHYYSEDIAADEEEIRKIVISEEEWIQETAASNSNQSW